jgi:hypothetical protein
MLQTKRWGDGRALLVVGGGSKAIVMVHPLLSVMRMRMLVESQLYWILSTLLNFPCCAIAGYM